MITLHMQHISARIWLTLNLQIKTSAKIVNPSITEQLMGRTAGCLARGRAGVVQLAAGAGALRSARLRYAIG